MTTFVITVTMFVMALLFENPVALDHEKAWARMRTLLDRLVTALDRDTFLDDLLDGLVDLLGADRGLVVLSADASGTGAEVINARGQGRALSSFEREEVSKTVIAEARRTGKCVVWEPHRQTVAVESIRDLGIITAMAAPLRSATWWGGDAGGVVYVDFRDPRKEAGELHREFLEAATVLVAAVLEQRERLAAAREDLRAARAQTDGADGPGLEELLRAPSMQHVRDEVRAALQGESSILILGESGSGKTALAHAIAQASGRQPVVRATLGMSDDLNTITSELFGHERGAYSGAVAKRIGLVELADGGTLVLDEILNLPKHAQQLLLDFTQFGTYRPLGWDRRDAKRARVRIVAATNGDLERAIREGRFRQDLYYRLAGTVLILPPLRERRGEIPAMAESHLARIDRSRRWRLSVPARRWLLDEHLPWSGNVRELEATMRRARDRALAEDPGAAVIRPEHFERRASPTGASSASASPPSSRPVRSALAVAEMLPALTADLPIDPEELDDGWRRLTREREQLDDHERQLIRLALDKHRGVISHAARELGVRRTSLISRMGTLGIDR